MGAAARKETTEQGKVLWDHNSRTCVEVERTKESVKYIPLSVENGLEVKELRTDEFDRRYKPINNYPLEKACVLMVGYARTIGATDEALNYLGRIINITKEERSIIMASAARRTKASQEEGTATKSRGKAKAATAKAATAEAPKSKAAPKAKAPKGSKGDGTKKPSAAQRFQELIMEGKLTDDQIFKKVQDEFGLDDNKRAYVNWYRNYLRKQGQNPPEPK